MVFKICKVTKLTVPELEHTQTAEKSCPYIDEISPGLFVAVGGCGRAAKCADEIGRIAADLAAREEELMNIAGA